MKHLIKDEELVAYLEGNLTKEEIKALKKRVEENGETDMLYHLQLSYNEGMKEYANFLLGEDDFIFDMKPEKSLHPEKYGMVADKIFPEKKD